MLLACLQADVRRQLDGKADAVAMSDALGRKANAATVSALVDKVEAAVDATSRTASFALEVDGKANTKVRPVTGACMLRCRLLAAGMGGRAMHSV